MPEHIKEKLNGKKFPRAKEADRVRKRHVDEEGETHETKRKEGRKERQGREARVLKTPTTFGVQGRCVLNPNGVDLSKR